MNPLGGARAAIGGCKKQRYRGRVDAKMSTVSELEAAACVRLHKCEKEQRPCRKLIPALESKIMPLLQWITNIPTPYRNHRYELMQRIFPEHGIDFEVLYMARSEPGRHWTFEADELRYPHRFFGGFHPRLRGVNLHFNPELLSWVKQRRADIVVVGGFSAPTLMLAPLLCARDAVCVLGCESHLQSTRHASGAVWAFKRALVRRYDGYIIPSAPSRAYLEALDEGVRDRPVMKLPNLVDEALFRDEVAVLRGDRAALRERWGVSDQAQLWVCPARLESFKGLDRFLPALEGVEGITFLIAGEGSLSGELKEMIARRSLPARLLGQIDLAQMQRLYAAADLFVLPSLSDPSPLSAVEATASRLPLFVSSRIGNIEDVLAPGENGWSFDPMKPEEVRERARSIAALSREELAVFGARSGEVYATHFDSEKCIHRLAESLSQITQTRRR